MQEFSIKDLECFTGIKAHTIRIWEQRYGLLAPDRTDTNIRKYTDNDLKLLLNVSLLNNMGYKISQIAQMSEEQIKDAITSEIGSENKEQHYFHALKISMLNYDEQIFNSVVEPYIAEHGVEKAFSELFIPFLRQIGILWQASVICPAQEHFISALIRQKIFSLIENVHINFKASLVPTVLYLPELEIHELSLLMMHYIFRKNGHRSILLGQSVPVDDLQQVYQRLGNVNFVSIFTTNPSTVLLADYMNKLVRMFENTDCHFHLTGNNVCQFKSPDSNVITIYPSAEALMQLLVS